MTDRELWMKTMKVMGAMVGGTVVFLGSISLILVLLAGGRTTPASEERTGITGPTMTSESRGSAVPPATVPRHGLKTESRPGESI
jgi:hypothetical protein